jgi:hypothetical protein
VGGQHWFGGDHLGVLLVGVVAMQDTSDISWHHTAPTSISGSIGERAAIPP